MTSPNRAYLATCLRHSAQIQPDGWTSDTLKTLYAIMEEERLIAKRSTILPKKGCALYIKVKYKE